MTFSIPGLFPKHLINRKFFSLGIALALLGIAWICSSNTSTTLDEPIIQLKSDFVNISGMTPAGFPEIPQDCQSGVTIAALQMNVLYVGIENRLAISVPCSSDKVQASMTDGQIKKVDNCYWIAIPRTPGEQFINVTANGKTTPVKFRVKYLPDPAAFVGNSRGGLIDAAAFKAQGGILVRSPDANFDLIFRLLSCRVGAIGGNYPIYQFANNEGSRWTGQAERIIEGATPGTTIYFDEIKVIGPDSKVRDLPPISFTLR